MKRYISLDIGDRTIGVAVSDLLGITAQGVETIHRRSLEEDIGRIGDLMEQYETNSLVPGYPRNMNGTEGERCNVVKAFMEEVKKRFPAAEITFWDERLSTVEANRPLAEASLSWKKKKKIIDKMAAVIILQGFLERQHNVL